MSTEETKTSAADGQSALKRFVSCCLTCKHWEGDKQKMVEMLDKSGDIVMHKKDGWPEYGGCAEGPEWLDILVKGDATAAAEVSANFGCNYYSADS